MNVSIVAGGAGFIGCNLLSRLVKESRHVVVLDNLCRGRTQYLSDARKIAHDRVHFYEVELSDKKATSEAFKIATKHGNIDEVWHLAANSDIPAGVLDANVDMRDTFMTTFSLLDAMKAYQVGVLHFASSSAIYGDLGSVALHEDIGPLLPISNYGAMKLASEAIISAAAEVFIKRANLFRFPNVVGAPATHGVIYDFIHRLKEDYSKLNVLGDGTQQKSYLHVSDLVEAMLHIREQPTNMNVFPINIGPVDAGVSVRFIAESVVQHVSPNATINYGVGNKGWVGDVPRFRYSLEKLNQLGWSPKRDSAEAIRFSIEQIAKQGSSVTYEM